MFPDVSVGVGMMKMGAEPFAVENFQTCSFRSRGPPR